MNQGTRLDFSNYFEGTSPREVSGLAQEAIERLENEFNVTSSRVSVYSRKPTADEGDEDVWVAHATAEGWL